MSEVDSFTMSGAPDQPKLFHLIFVHGTWGRGFFPNLARPFGGVGYLLDMGFFRRLRWRMRYRMPRWFEWSSIFRLRLEECLSDNGCPHTVHTCDWSGSNSIMERDVAAQKLAKLLDLLEERAPEFKRIVIAHSHGGNVAMRALSYVKSNSLGSIHIATLATPFLRVYDMPYQFPRFLNYPKLIFIFWFSGWICTLALSDLIVKPISSGIAVAILLPIALVALLLVRVLLGPFPFQAKPDEPPKKPARLAQATIHPGRISNILVLRGIDDEASLALAVGSLGARISHFVLASIGSPYVWPIIRSVFGVYFFIRLLSPNYAATLFFASTTMGTVALILGALLVSSAAKSIFGRELFFGGARCDVAVNSVPDTDGLIRIHTLPQTMDIDKQMRHSIYDNEFCPQAIVNWILES
jgi:hypothetical protein